MKRFQSRRPTVRIAAMKRYALFVLAFIAGGCAESNDAGMQLQQENVRSGGIMARVEAALDALDPKLRSFVILSSPSGDYVQTAGARDRLTIEYRRYAGQGRPRRSGITFSAGRTAATAPPRSSAVVVPLRFRKTKSSTWTTRSAFSDISTTSGLFPTTSPCAI